MADSTKTYDEDDAVCVDCIEDEALRELAPLLAAQPLNGEWIAYQAMAYRQLGDARYHELCDYELMVQPFDLEAPSGFANMAAFKQHCAFGFWMGELLQVDSKALDHAGLCVRARDAEVHSCGILQPVQSPTARGE